MKPTFHYRFFLSLAAILPASLGPVRASSEDPPRPPTLDDLERDLRAPRPETRRAAVKKLAALGERKAWDLVVGMLEDRDSLVADEAQVALGSATEPRLLNDLQGRAGLRAQDPWVRLRVAEAFGRMPADVDGEGLAGAIAPREPDLSRTLLWSLDRLARAKRLCGEHAKVLRAAERTARAVGDPGMRGAALVALAALDPIAAQPLALEMLDAREPELRCAALVVAGASTEQECLSLSRRMLADPAAGVRAQAVENLEKLRSRPAILALVERMEVDPRARLRWRILAYLRSLSGLEHGFDAAAWRTWAGGIEGRWTTGDAGGTQLAPIGDARIALAGLRLTSDRVCFLVDLSGSTWQTKVGERTRKEVLDLELRKALESLPEGTRFNVVPYTNDPIPWEKALVPATRANVKRASEWFERCHQTGRGNFWDAALLAMADPEVDTIVALTDGIPTGGHRSHLELMVELLVEQNRFRKVAFDSVLVDAPKSRVRLWAELAERTGGRSVVADLE